MEKKFFHVAYITDENYAMPTIISIISLIKNKHDDVNYQIHILADNVSANTKEQFNKIAAFSCKIDIVDADNSFYEEIKDGSLRGISHVTPTALLKFNLPNIFKKIDTLLYLDGDTIICKDISELFNIDISGYCLAAVKILKTSYNISAKLPKDVPGYFNSGVMLFNLNKMRLENITEKLYDYKKNGVNFFVDNDAFGVVLGEKALFLPLNYNFYFGQFIRTDFDEFNNKFCDGKYFDEEDCINDQKILHAANIQYKPWKYWLPWISDMFQYYYNMSPYRNIPLRLKSPLSAITAQANAMIESIIEDIRDRKEWRFPREKISKDSRIIMYGAGEVGQSFYNWIKDTNYCKIVLWVDKNYQKLNQELTLDDKIHSIEDINQCEQYDYILIAIAKEKIVKITKLYLENIGVSSDIIVTI